MLSVTPQTTILVPAQGLEPRPPGLEDQHAVHYTKRVYFHGSALPTELRPTVPTARRQDSNLRPLPPIPGRHVRVTPRGDSAPRQDCVTCISDLPRRAIVLVELIGFEPTIFCLQRRCCPKFSYSPIYSGSWGRIRTYARPLNRRVLYH